MTPKEIAAAFTGSEYPLKIAKDIEAAAKAAGIVIVYGASDDLMEFRGAVDDEVVAWEGRTVRVDAAGLLPDFDDIDKDDKDELRDYFKREGGGKEIEALWASEGDYSWTYKTEIPHETFEIVEDGAPYCRGIVFALADCR
jgi:hypothetical protein